MGGVECDGRQLTNSWAPGTFVIFCHIQKTAGMTVQRYLRKRFSPNLARRVIWRATRDARLHRQLVSAAQARTRTDGFFAGHFCFGMHRHLPHPASYMTFLRDPVKRIVSLYTYSASTPGAFYHAVACRRDLGSFVRDSGLMELDNGMVRFLSGSSDDPFINRAPLGTLTERDLERAKNNLESFFFFVGLQERFDESFLLLGKRLGDRRPRYLQLNATAPRRTPAPVDADILHEIEARNALDRSLYDYAREKLDTTLKSELPDLPARLEDLRLRNERYNRRLQPLYHLSMMLRPRASIYKT